MVGTGGPRSAALQAHARSATLAFGRPEGHDVEDVHRQAAYVCPRQVKPSSTTAPAALFLGSRESRNAAGCNTDEHLDEYDEHLDEDDAKRHRRARRHWPLAP